MILQGRGFTHRYLGSVRTRRIPVTALPFFWVAINGTDPSSIRASHNVSSITDNGVGDNTITFILPALNGNYAITSGAIGQGIFIGSYTAASATTGITSTAVRLATYTTDSGNVDISYSWVIGVARR